MEPEEKAPDTPMDQENPAESFSQEEPEADPQMQEFVSWLLRDPRKKESQKPRIVKRRKRLKKLKITGSTQAEPARDAKPQWNREQATTAPARAGAESENEENAMQQEQEMTAADETDRMQGTGTEAQPESAMSPSELLRHRILDARKKNLSLLSLSKITRVSYQTILNFVNGKTTRISPKVRRKLEEFFRIEGTGEEQEPIPAPGAAAPHADDETAGGEALKYIEALEPTPNPVPIPHLHLLFADTLEEEIERTQARLDYWKAILQAETTLASELHKISKI